LRLYEIEKKDVPPDFIGKIVYLNFSDYKGKPFVLLIVENSDYLETIKVKFEVFDSKLVNEFINKKFKLYDFIGLCYKETTATNSKTNEQFIKRRVSDTFIVHKALNLSKLAWRKYAQRSKQSDKAN
jgi:hypothetical protein